MLHEDALGFAEASLQLRQPDGDLDMGLASRRLSQAGCLRMQQLKHSEETGKFMQPLALVFQQERL